MKSHSTMIGLLLGISLALGYLAGRLHGELSPDDRQSLSRKSSQQGSPHIARASEDETALRTRLNPSQVAVSRTLNIKTQTERSESFSRYAQSARSTNSGSRRSQDGPRHIGEFRDPDILYETDPGPARNIGSFLDPDAQGSGDPSNYQVHIGEFIDPDIDG